MKNDLLSSIDEHLEAVKAFRNSNLSQVFEASHLIKEAFSSGKKLILFGNGGSAADAQHIAAEFTGRFVNERTALPAIALTTDTSALTAIGNDYGFDNIFKRQVEALALEGDVLLGISTSGNSANILKGIEAGRLKKCHIITLTGRDGGKMRQISDININIENNVTARIQELHILIGHLICQYLDK
jgi:D-sedoheptulose 7-phosphate isomerase